MDEDKKSAAMFREVETRLVWLLGACAGLIAGQDPAESGDRVRDDYQTRFAAIPPDGPPC